MHTPLFVLTSDLGIGSPQSAELKAVLLAEVPEARIIDLSHNIPPLSIRYAELALRNTGFTFPPGTTHVVVVDPGVGTDRRALAVKARDRWFVGPDNGVLSIATREPGAEMVSLDRSELWRHPVSNTFHGRDIFCPVAAKLALGAQLAHVGSTIDDPHPSTMPAPHVKSATQIQGETLGSDRFGNLLTNIPFELNDVRLDANWVFEIEGNLIPYRSTYLAAKEGRLIVTTGADRFIEIAVAMGSAAERLGSAEGIEVLCQHKRG